MEDHWGSQSVRLSDFQRYATRRPPDSLETLLASDERLRNVQTAGDPTRRPGHSTITCCKNAGADYIQYLKTLAGNAPLFRRAKRAARRVPRRFGELEQFELN